MTTGVRLSLAALFEQQVRRTPDREALRHRNRRITYADLNARANQIARYLRGRYSVMPGARVGVWGERGIETIATLLAIGKAGAAYVPVEPAAPPPRTAEILRSAGASLLVVPEPAPGGVPITGMRVLAIADHSAAIEGQDPADPEPLAHPEDVATILFTSGTTGMPKGILMRAAGVASLVTGMGQQFPFQDGDTFLLHRSLTIVGSIYEYFGPLLHGARGVMLTGDDARDPETIWTHLLGERVTHVIVSPTLADALSRHGHRYGLTSAAMRFSIIGGEPVSRRTIAGWHRIFPAGRHHICYGITESMYIAFFDTSRLDAAGAEDAPVPVGEPFQYAAVRIVDDRMEAVAPGEVGEICISGPCLSRGYLNAPLLTAERYVADPWAAVPGGILYRTGDLGRWREDGLIELKGRRDRQVKIRGFRVELDDVEAAIRRLPHVSNAAVAVGRDARQQPRLIAYVECDCVTDDDLRRALRASIPEYMVPAAFVLAPVPVTAGGKIDRRALDDLVAAAAAAAAPSA